MTPSPAAYSRIFGSSARRGDIWWLRQTSDEHQASDASVRKRPYLIVSSDVWNVVAEYPRVTVCPLSGAEHVHRRYDTDVVLRRKETRLPKDSVVRCTEIYTVFRDVLVERVSRVSDARMAEVDHAIGLYLAIRGAE